MPNTRALPLRLIAAGVTTAWLSFGLATTAGAQQGDATQATPETESAVPLASEPVAYDKEFTRLASLLGALHYLRNLCGETGSQWRDTMDTLLTADKAEGERRAKLIAAFNDGYRGFADAYVACNPRAAAIAEDYRVEGAQLAGSILARYKN